MKHLRHSDIFAKSYFKKMIKKWMWIFTSILVLQLFRSPITQQHHQLIQIQVVSIPGDLITVHVFWCAIPWFFSSDSYKFSSKFIRILLSSHAKETSSIWFFLSSHSEKSIFWCCSLGTFPFILEFSFTT